MNLLLELYFLIFGLLIGSFLNVVILRLPHAKDLVATRSACPKCGAQLKWFHNVPLVSFLFLRGKCAFCKTPISWRYPVIELIVGLVSLWLMPSDFTPENIGMFFFYFSIACIFICHLVIDLEHHLLLDSLNIYLLVLFLSYSFFSFHWTYWLIGGAIGFGAPLLVTWLFYKIRGQVGLGGGDIKLYGILGIFLGPIGVIFTIFLSCMVGAIVGLMLIVSKKMTKDKPMAFGPSILVVAAMQIFFPDFAREIQSLFFDGMRH